LGLGLAAIGPAHGVDYHVDNSCAKAGRGIARDCDTPDGPFLTLAAAFGAALVPGDRILMHATGRPYVEPTLATPRAGAPGRPITLSGEGPARPVWTGAAGERLRVEYGEWTFERLTLDGGAARSDLVRVRAAGVTFRDCDFQNAVGDGLSVGARAHDLTVSGCRFRDLGGDGDKHAITTGREAGDPDDYAITGLAITDSEFDDIGGDGIQLYEAKDSCRKARVGGHITGNRFTLGTREGRENAIDVKTTATAADPLVIARNRISGWDGSSTATGSKPVVLQHCSDHVHFVDNRVERGAGSGTCDPCFGLVVSASTASADAPVRGVKIIGNTFVGQKRGVQLGEGSAETALVDLEVFHNTARGLRDAMFRVAGPVSGAFHNNLVHGLVLDCAAGGDLAGAAASHNGWFGSGAERRSCRDTCGDLCDPSDTTGSDPGFADGRAGDDALAPGSPAVDRGTDVGRPYAGAAPDLGAREQ
jgi:hypothetical protein